MDDQQNQNPTIPTQTPAGQSPLGGAIVDPMGVPAQPIEPVQPVVPTPMPEPTPAPMPESGMGMPASPDASQGGLTQAPTEPIVESVVPSGMPTENPTGGQPGGQGVV